MTDLFETGVENLEPREGKKMSSVSFKQRRMRKATKGGNEMTPNQMW